MGCTTCRSKKGKCGNQYTNLRNLRNMLVKMYNATILTSKKEEYKEAIKQIDTYISQVSTSCIPDLEFNLIKDYVNNEYK